MTRTPRILYGLMPTAVLVLALSVGASGSTAAQATGGCQMTSTAVLKQNSKAEGQAKKLLGNTSYTPLVKSFTPEPTQTKQFTGYETIEVKSPKGTAPVVGYFKLAGSERCSVVITSAQVVLSRNAYLVKLKFPGEQGNPGKLKVTLISR